MLEASDSEIKLETPTSEQVYHTNIVTYFRTNDRIKKMLENRPDDALGSLVQTVETEETVEIVETVGTVGTVETVETAHTARTAQTVCTAHTHCTAHTLMNL